MVKNILKKNILTIIFSLLVTLTLSANVADAEEQLPKGKVIVIFRNDDLSAKSDAEHEKKVMEIFEKWHVPQTFGIIPNVVENSRDAKSTEFHLLTENEAMLNLLKKWHGKGLIEIALHGYAHQANFLYLTKKNGGTSEFRGLSYEEQLQRISRGKQLLENWFNTSVTTFLLPWNSHDKNTLYAAKKAEMKLISSYFRNTNDFSILSQHKDLLLMQDTISLEKFGNPNQIPITRLDRFKPALTSARQFIKQNNKPVLITVLYHSWAHKSSKDFQLLEDIVKEVSQSDDIAVMVLRDVATKFPETIRDISLIKLKAQSEVQKADKLFSRIGRDNPVTLNTNFDVLNFNYYVEKQKQAITLCRKFYLATAGLGMLVSIFYLGLVKVGLIRRWFAFGSSIFTGLMFLLLLVVAYVGPSVLGPGIGVIDTIMLIFVGTISVGFIIGYFSISRIRPNDFMY